MTDGICRYGMGVLCALSLTACGGEERDPIEIPGREGVSLSARPGTQIDADELKDREGNATTLKVGEELFALDFVAPPEGMESAVRSDGVSVKFGPLDGDGIVPDCHVFVTVNDLPLHASRPAVDAEDTCAHMVAVAEWLPDVERNEVADGLGQVRQALQYGTWVGVYNRVNAYANGANDYNSNVRDAWGLRYQCVHYVNRYYGEFFGHPSMKGTGNANQYYGTAAAKGLRAFANGGRTIPQVGDILPSNGGGFGHIAIVRAVGADYVDVIHQNWSNTASDNSKRLAMRVARVNNVNTYTVSGFSAGYPVQGWLRR